MWKKQFPPTASPPQKLLLKKKDFAPSAPSLKAPRTFTASPGHTPALPDLAAGRT